MIRGLLVGLVACAAAGCGSNVAPVAGKVTLDGAPLVGAVVVFQPDTEAVHPGPGSSGLTDDQGRYSLQLMNGSGTGAIIGKHKVTITAYEGDDTVPSSGSNAVFRKPLLPPEYNANSTLTFEVLPGGTDQANFEIKLKKK